MNFYDKFVQRLLVALCLVLIMIITIWNINSVANIRPNIVLHSDKKSISGDYIASFFTYSSKDDYLGATVAYSWDVNIEKYGNDRKFKEETIVFSSNSSKINLNWVGNREIVIKYPSNARIFKKIEIINNIKIRYISVGLQ